MPAPDTASASTASTVTTTTTSTASPAVIKYQQSFHATPQELKRWSRQDKIDVLRELRRRPVRRPTIALMCASDVLTSSGGLGDELYSILEQCLIAALDCNEYDQAAKCFAQLQKQFGAKSTRVRKLRGLLFESKGDFDSAKLLYKNLLVELPTDQFSVKRLVAMAKANGNYKEAISVLEKDQTYKDEDNNTMSYQEMHAVDIACFKELTQLHMRTGNVERAMFYAEECILCDPYDYSLHTIHGELARSVGQLDRAIAAFSQSLRLNDAPNNTRAAFGLYYSSCDAVAKGESKQLAQSKAEYTALKVTAAGILKGMYAGGPMSHVLDMALKKGEN